MKFKTNAELMSDEPNLKATKWGEWIFIESNFTLLHEKEEYEIDLADINSNAEIVDWIFQIKSKNWGDAQTVFNLLDAFEIILNPQANCCPIGEDKEFSGIELTRKFAKR